MTRLQQIFIFVFVVASYSDCQTTELSTTPMYGENVSCLEKLDVVLALDLTTDVAMEAVVNSSRRMIESFNIGLDAWQLGLIAFSDTILVIESLPSNKTKEDILGVLDTYQFIPASAEGVISSEAVQISISNMLLPNKRPGVEQILLLVQHSQSLEEAQRLPEIVEISPVRRIIIGTGLFAETELPLYQGIGYETYTYSTEEDVLQLEQVLPTALCAALAPPPTTTSVVMEVIQQIQNISQTPVNNSNVEEITTMARELVEQLAESEEPDLTTDIVLDVTNILNSVSLVQNLSLQTGLDFSYMYSVVLGTQEDVVMEANEATNFTNNMVLAMDGFIANLDLGNESSVTISQPNLEIGIADLTLGDANSITLGFFQNSILKRNTDLLNGGLSFLTQELDNFNGIEFAAFVSNNTITNLLQDLNETIRLSCTLQTTNIYLPNVTNETDSTESESHISNLNINSPVVGLSLTTGSGSSIEINEWLDQNENETVTIVTLPDEPTDIVLENSCGFWNTTSSGWDNLGGNAITLSDGLTGCSWPHLTVFGLFTQRNPTDAVCGGTPYNSGNQICCDGVLFSNESGNEACCKKLRYNNLTQFCCDGYVLRKPNGGVVRGCCDGRIYIKYFFTCCNKRLINRHRFKCINNKIVRKTFSWFR